MRKAQRDCYSDAATAFQLPSEAMRCSVCNGRVMVCNTVSAASCFNGVEGQKHRPSLGDTSMLDRYHYRYRYRYAMLRCAMLSLC